MRRLILIAPVALLASACAQGCAITKALYVAVVHHSGAPPRTERDRIAERQTQMMRELPRSRVLVLPVALMGREIRYDRTAAQTIARDLEARSLGTWRVADVNRPLPFEPQPNEAAIFWGRFKALSASVAASPDTSVDYVLLVDFFGSPEHRTVGAVHVMAVTGKGEMAYHGTWNKYQPLYKEIQPKSLDDAALMVVTDISRAAKD